MRSQMQIVRRRSPLLAALNLCVAYVFVSCAPDGSRIKDSGPTPGVFENQFLAFTLPEVKVGNEVKKLRTNHCFAIGALTNADSNEYNCTFFEFFNPGSGVAATSQNQGATGVAGKCTFEGTSSPRKFTCALNGRFACSIYNDALRGKDEKVMSLILVQNETKPFQAVSGPAQGISALGVAYPVAEGISLGEGDCKTANAQFLTGTTPAGSQAGGQKVTFELKNSTAIKTSSGQSNSPSMAEGVTKCTIDKPSAGTVTLTAESLDSSPSKANGEHYVVSKLKSITDSSNTEFCKDFIAKNSSVSVYLFRNHWTQK
jgi:hypothetical protein